MLLFLYRHNIDITVKHRYIIILKCLFLYFSILGIFLISIFIYISNSYLVIRFLLSFVFN